MRKTTLFFGIVIVSGAVLSCPSETDANIVLDLQFNQLSAAAGGGTPTNGQVINASGDFGQANAFDHSGNVYATQNIAGPLTYAVGLVADGGSIPKAPNPLPADWDASAIRGTGRNYVRYPANAASENLVNAFSGDFSAWTRIYREDVNTINGQFHHIFGSAQKNNFGWAIYALGRGTEASPSFQLEGFFGGELVGTETMPTDRLFSSNGPQLANNEWFDIGVTFSGEALDGNPDTVKVFLNGEKVLERSGDADFGAAPLGQVFSYGMDTFGNNGWRGLYDRIILWDGAVADSVIEALTPTPTAPPGDYNNNGTVDAADYVVWRNGDSPDDTQGGYDLWKANFGKPPGSGAAAGFAVPEPSALVLALLLCGGCLPYLRRRSTFNFS